MITRAQIRRQLRKNGGIMNAVPRQGYFLGGVGDFIGDALGKVGKVAKQVVKSPVGKAALLGLGAYGLGGGFGGNFGLGNIGAKIGGAKNFLFGQKFGDLGIAGPARSGVTKGLLGKLGLTRGGGSMMPTPFGGITGASLLTYFMSKGKTEEEAKELAQDVYRGKGLGLDLIQADMKKYRSGALSGSQAYDKGYRFLTPRNYMQAATGGRVGLANGSEGVEQMYLSDEAGVIPKKGNKGITKEDRNLTKEDFDSDKNYKRYIRQQNKKADGGRIGFEDGTMSPALQKRMMELLMQGMSPDRIKKEAEKQLRQDPYIRERMKIPGLSVVKEAASGGRIGKYGGGVTATMPRIPTGMPRVNAGGISELDYRQEGGFVPMGVKEKADDVPAMLSKNEFVMTANAVKGAGGGNVEKGAQKMYNTMKQLEGRIS